MKTALKVTQPVLIVFCFATLSVPAQLKMSKIELGADLATFIYQGDLTPSKIGSFKTMKLGADVYGIYKLNKAFSLKTNLMFGSLKGDESKYSKPGYRQQRALKFTTPVTEISESIVWNILPPANEGGRRLSPYISAGIGYAFLHIKRDYSNYNLAYFGQESPVTTGLVADTAHSLPRGLLVLPVSAGLRYALSNRLSLNLTSTYRFNSSDYLDGFSEAANPDKKDHFFTNAIGLIYTFGKKGMLDCPKMKF